MVLQEFDDALLRDDRQPIESLLATFGLESSRRSGGVIMVLCYSLSDFLLDVWRGR